MTDKFINKNKLVDCLKTDFIGRKVFFYPELSSTNKTAAELAQKGEKEGTVVIAEKQTGGRGRRGRSWYSPAGTGLWFSIILRPEIPPKDSHFLTVNASLAVYKALEDLGFRVDIKWPNDLLYNGSKLCGILSELNATSTKIKYAVTGIGLNVNQYNFPENIRDKANSLYKIKSKKVDRLDLLSDILLYFERYYERFLTGNKDMILKEWKKKINLLGKEIKLENEGEIWQGEAIDITKDGRLMISTSNGDIKKFWTGDTSIIK